MGIQLQPLATFAVRRKWKHDRDSVSKVLQKHKKQRLDNKQRLDSKHQASSSSPDSSFGSLAADPGPTPEELLKLCREHLDRLMVTADGIR